ncbi:DEAD/DEAH box helicase [Patescibacteria group bacterium]|nr:DEAD/DEAH box helicase [Patescibacteria group bacterium]MBU1246454.1 DEAD/DEAH box helicase [Patescibacteria group bacterium]MBU1730590.1 DEAD/DEAH box helicase [Patescibacteria group bacterium]MBU1956484.1 DEAD/DEAH box helicase [Patescibacteria group bacterium]MBU2010523.1 DEAD/DEAH box helicase [Patescibacteria group bacterium]
MVKFDYKNLLRRNLKEVVGPVIYGRGLGYYNSGRVQTITAFEVNNLPDKIKIKGNVLGTDDYESSVVFDFETLQFDDMDCDCPYYDWCKHSTALALEFIDQFIEFLEKKQDKLSGKLLDNLLNWVNKKQNKKIKNSAQKQQKEQQKKKIKQQASDKYYIIIKIDDDSDLNVLIVNKERSRYSYSRYLPTENAQDILEDEEIKLSLKQQRLFEFLKGTDLWRDDVDYGLLFELLKESEIEVYVQQKSKNNKLIFNDKPLKIKAEIIKQNYEYCDGPANTGFTFKLDRQYKNKKKFSFYPGKKFLVIVENNIVNSYKLPAYIIKVILRATKADDYRHYYHPTDVLETTLEENEIIKLDKLIKECKHLVALKLPKDINEEINIKKFKNPNTVIVVDYDAQNSSLEILPSVDYGFTKIPVTKSVSYSFSWLNNTEKFQRKNDDRSFGEKYLIGVEGQNISYSRIDEKMETELFKKFYINFEQYGFAKKAFCRKKRNKQIMDFFNNHWPSIKKLGYKIEFLHDKFDFSTEDFKVNFKVDLNADNDWLAFDADCYCGKDKVGIQDLKNYIVNKNGFIKMKDGRLLRVTNQEELERFIMMLEGFYERENGKFEGRIYHAPELHNIFTSSKHYDAQIASGFTKFIEEAKKGRSVKKIKLPIAFDKILRNYQKEGVNWFYFLRKYHFAGILADDMGLGKTAQALALIEMTKVKNCPSIVIAPKTVLYNWQDEVLKFTPKLKSIIIDGLPATRKEEIEKIKKYDLVLTSYPILQKDFSDYEKQKIKFNYAILDEAQFIKNHKTKNAQTVKKINANYRLALTGTPLENNVAELWSIFEFLMPGFLGSYKLFVNKFQNPIMKKSSNTALQHLNKKIECFMLRRTKDKILKELPPKIEQVSHCELSSAQSLLYQEVLTNVKREIFDVVDKQGFAKSQIHILAGLTKLRQVCNHPALLLKKENYEKYKSAKLNLFMDLVREIMAENRKVLVFSQFTSMLDILAKELDKNKINYSYLSGQTKNRQDLVREFNQSKTKQIFLISLKAGGVGINLTSADNVIIFDPWWNPSVERQAIDRTHRIGQKNSVNVYRLITKGTIEDQIVKLQEKKQFLFDSLVGESANLFKKLTWDDIKKLFD